MYSAVLCWGIPEMSWTCFSWRQKAVSTGVWSADSTFQHLLVEWSYWISSREYSKIQSHLHGPGFPTAKGIVFICWSKFRKREIPPSQISHWLDILSVEVKLHFAVGNWVIDILLHFLQSRRSHRTTGTLLFFNYTSSSCTLAPKSWQEICGTIYIACVSIPCAYSLDIQYQNGSHTMYCSHGSSCGEKPWTPEFQGTYQNFPPLIYGPGLSHSVEFCRTGLEN